MFYKGFKQKCNFGEPGIQTFGKESYVYMGLVQKSNWIALTQLFVPGNLCVIRVYAGMQSWGT